MNYQRIVKDIEKFEKLRLDEDICELLEKSFKRAVEEARNIQVRRDHKRAYESQNPDWPYKPFDSKL